VSDCILHENINNINIIYHISANENASPGPQNTTAKVNQSVSFSCSLSTAPEDILWHRGTDLIYAREVYYDPFQQRFFVNVSTGESTLTISPVLPEDAGQYICEDGGFATERKLFAFLIVLGQCMFTYSFVLLITCVLTILFTYSLFMLIICRLVLLITYLFC